MFDPDASRDPSATRTTRRAFLAGTAAVLATGAWLYAHRLPGVETSTATHGPPGEVTLIPFTPQGQPLAPATVAKIVKTDGQWYQQLGKNSYEIAREADTETPYFGVTWNEHRPGLYRCLCCETALFSSITKFDSGTGWPSFWAPIAKQNIAETNDHSLLETRTEVHCARCDAHLGHVFSDGPEPTGLRYCMNSASLHFLPA